MTPHELDVFTRLLTRGSQVEDEDPDAFSSSCFYCGHLGWQGTGHEPECVYVEAFTLLSLVTQLSPAPPDLEVGDRRQMSRAISALNGSSSEPLTVIIRELLAALDAQAQEIDGWVRIAAENAKDAQARLETAEAECQRLRRERDALRGQPQGQVR